jgi:tRNA (cmo5U34)-methyltransferase
VCRFSVIAFCGTRVCLLDLSTSFDQNVCMSNSPDRNLWTEPQHAREYLQRADSLPHRTEGESTLLELVPKEAKRILDLGSGNARLLKLVRKDRPGAEFVALDFSSHMLEALHQQFDAEPKVTVVAHDFSLPLPLLGSFDAVISSFAIHHVTHERKRRLYAEIFDRLRPGGVFCNLEHVSSPTERLHLEFLRHMGMTPAQEDASNKLLDLETQLTWLREIGFADVDCLWKWRELALFAGVK